MPITHRLLAVSVAVMWGLNFLAIDASLAQFPPYFLVALRFALIAMPTILLVPFPKVQVRWLIGYGLGFGTLQFLFLYWGMAIGMPPGLASLVLQASAPFTVLLGATLLRERLSAAQVVGILIAVAGLAIVGMHRAGTAALAPFLLTVAGAFGWALGNICNRQARATEPLRFTLWMSVVPPLPMLALSLAVEGSDAIAASFTDLTSPTGILALAGLAYTILIGTVAGSGIWSWLMARHAAGVVAPFSLLVPVVGIAAAWIVLGQAAAWQELIGGALLVGGVLLGSLRPGSPRQLARPRTSAAMPASNSASKSRATASGAPS
ncbi:EamA family transporter [Microbacterium halophytorum]|uniref:EamA family transporter n=1 Tax=Microbacterium halophytorum TaxID=2067568 RepID=UPI000CFB34CC|nr:EamA family transporter [Microbacterium halophytorum]